MTRPLTVMCLNAWGGALHDALLPYLADQCPDVLCLQEVVHTPEAPQDSLEYRDGDHILPQRADVLGEVSRVLPDHIPTFCPAARGPLWLGAQPVDSYWGLATWVHRRLIITGQHQGFVHGSFGIDGFGDHPRSRTGHALRLFDPARRMFLSVAQMHGLRDLAGKGDTHARLEQARRFADMAAFVTRPGDRRILCGDFNVLPESETLQHLQAMGLTELVTSGTWPGTRTASYPKPQRFADYMLVDAETAAQATFEVVYDPEVSDHCPLVLTL